MSETTTTPNYGLIKPNVNADSDLWGDHWNQNADTLDSKIKSIENKAGVVTWNTRSGAVSLSQADVTTVLPPGAGTPAMDGTATAGALLTWSRSDHVHPTDTTRYAASNPAGYVTSAQAGTAAPVQSVATRTGAVVLTHNDLTDWAATLAPYAPLASPALTGTPTAPTVSPTTDASTKLATTAFVQAALTSGGVVSFNTRTGAITLSSADITAAGGALLASPIFTGDPQAPQPAAGDADASIATTAFVSGSVASAHRNVGRNLLHNPLFNVAQRGVGPWTTNSYTLDRWRIVVNLDTCSLQQFAVSDAGRAQIGDEAAKQSINAAVTGNAGAAAQTVFGQPIEDVRRLAGKTVTVSFWAATNSGTLKVGVSINQNFGSGGSPSASVIGTGQAVTINATWTRYSLTFVVPSIAGKVLGTAGDDNNLMWFWFSAGANNNTQSGNVGVQSGSINLWGVQLEIGSVATPLEKPDPRYDLANCQRFAVVGSFATGGYEGTTGAYADIWLQTVMRTAPTVVLSNLVYTNASAATVAGTYPTQVSLLYSCGTGNTRVSGIYTASADL